MEAGGTRRFTRRTWFKAAATLSAVAAADALILEPRWLEVTTRRVLVPGLPTPLEGLRVAQLTDCHLTGVNFLEEKIARALDELAPQLVVLTGDIVDSNERFGALSEWLTLLKAPGRRLIATLGNWEHWGRVTLPDLRRRYADQQCELLVDEWSALSSAGLGVGVYATDDSTGGRPRAVKAYPKGKLAAQILLSHSPELLDSALASPRFDYCLSGHTHGGQIRALGYAPVTPPGSGRFVAGEYSTPRGPAYVSRGTGTSVVPARFCARPELAVFELARG